VSGQCTFCCETLVFRIQKGGAVVLVLLGRLSVSRFKKKFFAFPFFPSQNKVSKPSTRCGPTTEDTVVGGNFFRMVGKCTRETKKKKKISSTQDTKVEAFFYLKDSL
jgi:hypothetical protein